MDGTHAHEDTWSVAGRTFRSRLIVGTGKYKDYAQNAAAARRRAPRSSRWPCAG
jgi:thiazole synthase